MAKKEFNAQQLRGILGFLLVVTILGGGALFYFGLDTVRTYAVSVNQRIEDANASDTQVQQLQVLQSQLAQSESLISKADRTFTTPEAYQSQALVDIQNYANQSGISVTGTDFETPEGTNKHIAVIKVANPVNYQGLITFLRLLEGNLPKMQVVSMKLDHIQGSTTDIVQAGDIKVNISVR